MIRKSLLVLVVLVLTLSLPAFAGSISIAVLPSLAPNAFGSPSWTGYRDNALYALENGLSSYGDPNSPTYYSQNSSLTYNQLIATGFPSWMGMANPGTVFGPAYANELGNREHFGLVINGNGQQFSISELSFTASSSDAGDLLGFSYGAGSYNYSSDYVGGIWNGSGYTLVTSGPSTQLVDVLWSRGSGNTDAAYCTSCTTAQQQAAIDSTLATDYTAPFSFTGVYSLVDQSGATIADGSATVNVGPVPEPATLTLLLCGLGLLVMRVPRPKLFS